MTRENFWESLSEYVGTLKLRGSYGELGNQNTKSWYPTYQTLGVSAGGGGWIQNGIKPNTATVPGLISSTMGWERIRNWNIGLDFGAFNNRLTGSFDYYTRETLDMIGPDPRTSEYPWLKRTQDQQYRLENLWFRFRNSLARSSEKRTGLWNQIRSIRFANRNHPLPESYQYIGQI